MNNIDNTGKVKFLSYILIILSLFAFFFFTSSNLSVITELKESNEVLTWEIKDLEEEHKTLNKIKAEIESGEISFNVEKYINSLDENEILDYFYSYAAIADNGVKIRNISILKWDTGKTGFSEGTINLNVRVANEEKLLTLIDSLISEEAKYKFFIENLSYPIGFEDETTLNIPLIIFYK